MHVRRHFLNVSAVPTTHQFRVLPVVQVRDCIEKENVSGQPKGDLPPLPPPGHKIDIKVTTTTFALSCSHGHPVRKTLFAAIWMKEQIEPNRWRPTQWLP